MKNFESKRSFATLLATTALTATFLTGCMEDASKTSAGAERKSDGMAILEQTVIENIANNVIVATYNDLNLRTHEMADLAKVLQVNPTAENLSALQAKWRETRVPWESSESFVFGPGSDTDAPIDSWPLSINDLNEILATRQDLGISFVRTLNNELKGFHTAEFLIFGDGVEKNTKSIQEMTPAQLKYLVSVTAVIAEETERLYSRWTIKFDPSDAASKAYTETVNKPGFDNPQYGSRKAVLDQYVRAMSKIANEVGAVKLQTPLGGDLASADGSQVESQFSWNSLTDFKNNIHSLRNMYTGDYGGRFGAGLDEIVKLRNPELDRKMLSLLDESESAIVAIGGAENLSYTQAIQNPAARARARVAIDALSRLGAAIDDELLKVL